MDSGGVNNSYTIWSSNIVLKLTTNLARASRNIQDSLKLALKAIGITELEGGFQIASVPKSVIISICQRVECRFFGQSSRKKN